MADGSQGGMGGVLFEAGKTIAGQAKQTGQTVASQLTGQTFTPKPQSGSFTPKSSGGSFSPKPPPFGGTPGALPKMDNLGGAFGGLFEKNATGKQNALAQQQQQAQAQAQLDQIAAQNKAADQAKIAALTQKLHNEVYYNKIAQSGGSLAQERHEREQKDILAEDQRRQAKEQQLSEPLLGNGKIGNMFGKLLKKPVRASTHETPKDNG